MDYELTYKKIHNTLKPDKAPNGFGNKIGQKLNNLVAPTLKNYRSLTGVTQSEFKTIVESALDETEENGKSFNYMSTMGIDIFNNNVPRGQYSTNTPMINADFYTPEFYYEKSGNGYSRYALMTNKYQKYWYFAEENVEVPNFASINASDGYYNRRFYPYFKNDRISPINHKSFCSHKIAINLGTTYHWQAVSRTGAMPADWKVGFQILNERIVKNLSLMPIDKTVEENLTWFPRLYDIRHGEITRDPGTIYFQKTLQAAEAKCWDLEDLNDANFIIQNINGRDFWAEQADPTKISVPDLLGPSANIQYGSYANLYSSWWKNSTFQFYVIIWLIYVGESSINDALKELNDNITFCFYEGDATVEIDENSTILRYLSSNSTTSIRPEGLITQTAFSWSSHFLSFLTNTAPKMSLDNNNNLNVSVDIDKYISGGTSYDPDMPVDQQAARELLKSRLDQLGYELVLVPYRDNNKLRAMTWSWRDTGNTHINERYNHIRFVDGTDTRNSKHWGDKQARAHHIIFSQRQYDTEQSIGRNSWGCTAIYLKPYWHIGYMRLPAWYNNEQSINEDSLKYTFYPPIKTKWDILSHNHRDGIGVSPTLLQTGPDICYCHLPFKLNNSKYTTTGESRKAQWGSYFFGFPKGIYEEEGVLEHWATYGEDTPADFRLSCHTTTGVDYPFYTRFSNWGSWQISQYRDYYKVGEKTEANPYKKAQLAFMPKHMGIYDYQRVLLPILARLRPTEKEHYVYKYVTIRWCWAVLDRAQYLKGSYHKALSVVENGKKTIRYEKAYNNLGKKFGGDMPGDWNNNFFVGVNSANGVISHYFDVSKPSEALYIDKDIAMPKNVDRDVDGDLPELSWYSGTFSMKSRTIDGENINTFWLTKAN